MASAPLDPDESRRLLELARSDREAAAASLAALSPDDQVALVCEAPLAQRAGLLALLPQPEQVIPRLPEAELCFTVKSAGLSDAAWILAQATSEQIVAGVAVGGVVLGVVLVLASTVGVVYDPGLAEAVFLAAYLVLMLGVCSLACVVPTSRALGIEPTEALRAEV